MMSGLSTSRQLLISVIILGFIALLGIVTASMWLGYTSQINFENSVLARDIRSAAAELRNGLQAAESSQRGYQITKNEIYLAPFSAAKASSVRQLQKLQGLMENNRDMQPAMARLKDIVSTKLNELDKIVSFNRGGDDKSGLAIITTNSGKRLMDEANLFIAAIIQQTDNRLTASATEERVSGWRLRIVSQFGAIIIIAIAIGIWLMIRRNTQELIAMRDNVLEINSSLEQRVLFRTAKLAQANQEIQRFAYIVTHDLRAPLVNIMGFTSEMERSLAILRPLATKGGDVRMASTDEMKAAIEEDMPEALQFIRTSANKMDGLINAILQLARVGQRQLRPEVIKIKDIVDEALAVFQFKLAEIGGNVETNLSIVDVETDRVSIAQIFGNLFDNAIKYRSATRPLLIKVTCSTNASEEVIIEVTDNGRGISGDDTERIFEMFRRSGKMDQPGEGIGLSYVRSLLHRLGGDIRVESQLGLGTTFRFNLPKLLHAQESDQ